MFFVGRNETSRDDIDLVLDEAGVEGLRVALERLVAERSHIHPRGRSANGSDLDELSPWEGKGYSEIILTWVGE
jgi:hypothetical protein